VAASEVGVTENDSVISASDLASSGLPEISEFEYGLLVVSNSFDRWIERCMAATGGADLGKLDIHVLKEISHRAKEKKVADICFILNVEDTHIVTYSLKKLERRGFITGNRHGKEMLYRTTETGEKAVSEYKRVRQKCLIEGLKVLGTFNKSEVRQLASLLRAFSGIYDQAARSATSFWA